MCINLSSCFHLGFWMVSFMFVLFFLLEDDCVLLTLNWFVMRFVFGVLVLV